MTDLLLPHYWFSRSSGAFCDALWFEGDRLAMTTLRVEETAVAPTHRFSLDEESVIVSVDDVQKVIIQQDRTAIVIHYRCKSETTSQIEFLSRSSIEHDRLVIRFAEWLGSGYSLNRRRVLNRAFDDITEKTTNFVCVVGCCLVLGSVMDAPAKGLGKVIAEVAGPATLRLAGILVLVIGGLFLVGWNIYRWSTRPTVVSFVRNEASDA